MATVKGINISDNASKLEIIDAIIQMQRQLDYYLSFLDSENVIGIDTNITKVKSSNGETELEGSLLLMRDGSETLRLKQGYNPTTGQFEFTLYNMLGEQTVGIDDQGNAVFENQVIAGTININNGTFTVNESGTVEIFSGTLLITRADNLARVKINAIDGFKLQKGDGTGLDTSWTDQVYFDNEGNAVIKGIIRTNDAPNRRVELAGNQIRCFNDNNYLNGLVTDGSEQQFGDVKFYDGTINNGELVFSIVNNLGGTGVSLQPKNGAGLIIGANGHNTRMYGNINGVIQVMTNTELNAKTDAIENQVFGIPYTPTTLGAALQSTATLAEVITLVNQLRTACLNAEVGV